MGSGEGPFSKGRQGAAASGRDESPGSQPACPHDAQACMLSPCISHASAHFDKPTLHAAPHILHPPPNQKVLGMGSGEGPFSKGRQGAAASGRDESPGSQPACPHDAQACMLSPCISHASAHFDKPTLHTAPHILHPPPNQKVLGMGSGEGPFSKGRQGAAASGRDESPGSQPACPHDAQACMLSPCISHASAHFDKPTLHTAPHILHPPPNQKVLGMGSGEGPFSKGPSPAAGGIAVSSLCYPLRRRGSRRHQAMRRGSWPWSFGR